EGPRISSREASVGKPVLGGRDQVRVAVAQVSPVFMDKEASLRRAEETVAEAARGGADLVAFPEAWLAGYPYWTEGWDSPLPQWVAARIRWRDNAVVVGTDDTERLAEAARRHGVHVVMGCNELDDRRAVSTVYNTLLFFDRDGRLLGRHRKLMPTHGERQFWGQGGIEDVQVFETDVGRVGGLICGEHMMPLVHAAMIELGEELHVAAFPGSFALHTGPRLEELDTAGDFWGIASTRNHAFEAGAFVLRACAVVEPADISADFPFAGTMNIDYARGGSGVVSPLGVPLVDTAFDSQIVYADCPAWMIKAIKAMIDTVGHYSRPDLLALAVRGPSGWVAAREPAELPAGFGDRPLRAADARQVDPAQVAAVAVGRGLLPAALDVEERAAALPPRPQ
ncbi:MAG TPA: carbon-nitrogen hydrolase family protein, partial [Frankiaceae bacterium]|nr:carbon-nitrogen hydrolase family protein [Frankiaceae bacterium]